MSLFVEYRRNSYFFRLRFSHRLFLSVSVLWHAIEAKDRNYTTAAMYSNNGGGRSGLYKLATRARDE